MANCVNCGKKITVFNSSLKWNFNEKTMCFSCTEPFDTLLVRNGIAWRSNDITRDLIDENRNFLKLNQAGIDFLYEYAEHIQRVNPKTPEQQKEAEKKLALERARKQAEEEEQRLREQANAEKSRAMASMLISSGFNFEGYRIVKYSGYISGDDAVQIPRSGVFGGNNGQNLTDALVRIRRQALKELKEAAYDLGCNAVIGVDFDYLTLDPETATLTGGTLYEPYVICVTANGNAVVIEKIED
ncbi:MAG: YbjQ family protein [Oscillospiraceae bacterium]|nr:YbjQ family protein [Oscillospiraceae bacterium]